MYPKPTILSEMNVARFLNFYEMTPNNFLHNPKHSLQNVNPVFRLGLVFPSPREGAIFCGSFFPYKTTRPPLFKVRPGEKKVRHPSRGIILMNRKGKLAFNGGLFFEHQNQGVQGDFILAGFTKHLSTFTMANEKIACDIGGASHCDSQGVKFFVSWSTLFKVV